jgi:hypothetical protein
MDILNAFASPWLLAFLAALPILWWVLRLAPPSPRKINFPAIALLRDLIQSEETSARTPWWVLILRMLIVFLIIIGFAQPVIGRLPRTIHHGPLLIVIDNDWASARDWSERQNKLLDIIHEAGRDHRKITFIATTPSANGDPVTVFGPVDSAVAASHMHDIAPEPWPADWIKARALLQSMNPYSFTDVCWLASGLGTSDTGAFYESLQQIGNTEVIDTGKPVYLLQTPVNDGEQTEIFVLRANVEDAADVTIDALARDGNIIHRLPAHFPAGGPRASASLDLPLDIRNQIARFEIEGQHSAATTVLVDSEWEHPAIGLVGDPAELERHSLLNNLFYIDRALKPYADIHIAKLDDLLKQKMPILILTDSTLINDAEIKPLTDWIRHGGILLRFAGEHLATAENPAETDILPEPLRTGDRAMGGALSWLTPQKLQAFAPHSLFIGLTVPDDVTITRQILAEPSTDPEVQSWANLEDGTPLVTARKIGSGLTILFHVPARADWSNLPLSGLFVDMLRRVLTLAHGTPDPDASFSNLQPLHTLNAFGDELPPSSIAQPIKIDDWKKIFPSPLHPPGFYGDSAHGVALNLGDHLEQPDVMRNISVKSLKSRHWLIELKPALLLAAFILMLIDFLISLYLRGHIILRRITLLLIIGFLSGLMVTSQAQAKDISTSEVELTAQTTLAYVHTGAQETDSTSRAGLTGLAEALQRRTSLDHVAVSEVNPNRDDLAFYPLIYWPLVSSGEPLTSEGRDHVNDYLHHGGMILFDALDGEDLSPALIKQIMRGVDVPPLNTLPDNHVLKRSFYLLDEFPGRYNNHDFFLEPEDLSSYDGVATVLFGSNDWAAAWAMDDQGHPIYPCIPGGELQREHAYRFGINLVMYALTGNYKSDQMHVQALLNRVGK